MIFTLTDRMYNVLDAYETEHYLIGQYIGSIIETLDIDVSVRSINADLWVRGNYIMCEDKSGRPYWFTIYEDEDGLNDDIKSFSCYSGTIDVVAEESNPIKAAEAQPFSWYFDRIFVDTGIKIGMNEISGLSRKLEFTSENATNVEMLQYVLNGFDNAEARLDVKFNCCTPAELVLNVYKQIGEEQPQALLSDEDDSLTDLSRKGSLSELGTCINLQGAETDEKTITLEGKYYEEKDTAGNILYYSPKESTRIFSVQARKDYYVKLPGKANGEFDGYINRRYKSEASTQDALWSEGLKQLKKVDHAIVEYDAKGDISCGIGDYVQVVSHTMRPPVMISARTIEYKFNDDDPTRNEYKFSNYVELESNMDDLNQIINKIKESIIYITGQEVSYCLSDRGDLAPESGWTNTNPGAVKGKWLWIRTITTMSNGEVSTIDAVSYAALDGEQGTPGKAGADGKTPYVHFAWANSADGKTGFSTTDSANKLYIGTYTDYTSADSTDPTKYAWTLVKGDKGDDGPQGIQGPKGNDGQPTYTWLKYADSPTAGMSDSPTGKAYIGLAYNKTTAIESSNYADYTWSLIQGAKGDTGVQGPKGTDGQTTYTWIKYGTSAAGAGMSDSPTGKTYIGIAYNKTTATESTNAADYTWSLIQGPKGDTGEKGASSVNLLPNSTWNLGKGNWVYPDSTYEIIAPEADKPSSYILHGKKHTSTSQQAYTMPHPIWVDAGKIYTIAFDYRETGYTASKNIIAVRVYETPTIANAQANSLWYLYRTHTNLGITSNVTEFTRYNFEITPTASGYMDVIPYDYDATGNHESWYREIMVVEGSKEQMPSAWLPNVADLTGAAGADAISAMLSSEAVAVPCDVEGNVADFSKATGNIYVYKGATDVSASATYAVTWSGMTGTWTAGTRLYKVTAMSADTGTLTIKATYSGTTITKVFTVTKSLKNLKVNSLDALSGKMGNLEAGIITNTYNNNKALVLDSYRLMLYDWNYADQLAGYIASMKIGGPSSLSALRIDGMTNIEMTINGTEVMHLGKNSVTIDTDMLINQGLVVQDELIVGGRLTANSMKLLTSEIETGETWVDGRPIYTKTFNVGAISSANKTIAHGIANIGTFRAVDSAHSYVTSSGSYYAFPRVATSTSATTPKAHQTVSASISATSLIVEAGSDANFTGCYVTIKYTKTTD